MKPAPAAPADGLTRTTLRIEASGSALSIAQVIRALQRVPGVLVAEINAASTRAIVAHDAAVPTASLLAAVAGAGGQAQFIADTRGPALRGATPLPAANATLRRLVTLMTWILATLTIGAMLIPKLAATAWLLPVLIAALWACFFADAILRRRS